MFHVHQYGFQITHGMKQCTMCQRTNFHDTINHDEYLPRLELLRWRDINAKNEYASKYCKTFDSPLYLWSGFNHQTRLEYYCQVQKTSCSVSVFIYLLFFSLFKLMLSTLNGSSLKLVDKFTYLGSSVSSTETDINTWLAKAWTAMDRLSVIWKLDLTDKMKCRVFQAAVVSILLYGCTTWTLTKRM